MDTPSRAERLAGPRQVAPCRGLFAASFAAIPFSSRRNFNRGDWRSFEPLIAAYVDAALSPETKTIVGTWVMNRTA